MWTLKYLSLYPDGNTVLSVLVLDCECNFTPRETRPFHKGIVPRKTLLRKVDERTETANGKKRPDRQNTDKLPQTVSSHTVPLFLIATGHHHQ